ncbi:MAG: methylated-DNA--[protein]-cysteine S-methyltransferase [Sedimentisphaerales bacterium]|nr:methylated-DNA--[protein]-cysteine S-methyltransferase [Sedimentisphaerales bacterium]
MSGSRDGCEYHYRIVNTSWGPIAYICRGEALCHLWLDLKNHNSLTQKMLNLYPAAQPDKDLLNDLHDSLMDYFTGRQVEFNCTIDISWASPFTRSVLRQCSKIKPGHTLTYSQLACRLGKPNAARAVGNALGSNRVPLIIPCHRITAAAGRLGGYSAPAGPQLKKRLLLHESNITSRA